MTIEKEGSANPETELNNEGNAANSIENNSILGEAGKEASKDGNEGSILAEAGKEEREAREAEEKRLLETDDEDLSEEDREKKAELIKTKEEEAKKDKADKSKETPEKYEIKMPEGVELDEKALEKATPMFKELGLNNDQAQKVVDLFIEVQKEQQEKQQKAMEDDFKKYLKDSYEETIKALGADYKQQLSYVAKVRDKFFSKETREALDASGLSNNKHLIKDLIEIGKSFSEDKIVSGKSQVSGAETAAKKLYPNLK